MTPGARVAAAIEILAEIEARHRPVVEALKDYGTAHRFAGSKDRVAIAGHVYDALRRRASAAWIMASERPRAVLLGSLRLARGLSVEEIAALCGGGHAPEPLTDEERERLDLSDLSGAPPAVAADVQPWLEPHLRAVFGEALVEEARALAGRAPVDLRVNTLKTTRHAALEALAHLGATPTPHAPEGIRLPAGPDGRGPALGGEPVFIKGLVEVQDEGSQLAAALASARPGQQVLDLCAGGGGKTLALAAAMANKGQVYATDSDGRRLAGLFPRLTKSGARNVQIRAPKRGEMPLDDLVGRCDLVFVDAPCTGTGTWRRNPDAKWRLRPGALEQRVLEQAQVLDAAVPYVKAGGRLVYVTCSLLLEENEGQIEAFRGRHPDFNIVPPAEVADAADLPALAACATPDGSGLRLTPLRTGTDGFYIAMLRRG